MGNVPEKRVFTARETDLPALKVLEGLDRHGEEIIKIACLGDIPDIRMTEIFVIMTNPEMNEPVKSKCGGFVMIDGNADVTATQVLSALGKQYASA